MLNNWQKNINKYVPKKLPGYEFICRIPVFIPVQMITISVWERRVQSLSFIQECVLTSIQLSTKSLSELSAEFGLPESIMLQIVAQLDSEQLAAVSAGSIILTDKGKHTLETQQKTKICQNYLSRIHVNQITGEITDAPLVGTYHEPPRGKVYLREVYPITLNFLRGHFDTIATISRENRVDRTAFRTNLIETAELYRILDVAHNELSYIRESCFVFLNQEDKSLAFQFQSGIKAYADTFSEQINSREIGAWNLLSQPKRLCGNALEAEGELPVKLIEAFTSNVNSDERATLVENEYYKDRLLLDGEVMDILSNCSDFRAEKILLEFPYLGEFINGTVISALLSSHTKELVIRFNSHDRRAQDVIKEIREKSKNKRDFHLVIQEVPSVSGVRIYIGGKCAITGQYVQKNTVYNRHIYKLYATVTFDSIQIETLWREILP